MDKTSLGIDEIFQAAIEKDSPAELKAYLDHVCNGDAQLRATYSVFVQGHNHDECQIGNGEYHQHGVSAQLVHGGLSDQGRGQRIYH